MHVCIYVCTHMRYTCVHTHAYKHMSLNEEMKCLKSLDVESCLLYFILTRAAWPCCWGVAQMHPDKLTSSNPLFSASYAFCESHIWTFHHISLLFPIVKLGELLPNSVRLTGVMYFPPNKYMNAHKCFLDFFFAFVFKHCECVQV